MDIKNIYISNVVNRWEEEISDHKQIRFLSPYITSKTAEIVLLSPPPQDIEIYTVFKVENFAAGASSIKTLIKLFKKGCKLFHVDQLHAKILLTQDSVSIGSQNLTHSGTLNLEASVLLTEQESIQYTTQEVERWLINKKEITEKMLKDMEFIVEPLFIKYVILQEEFQKADQKLLTKEKARNYKSLLKRITKNISIEKDHSQFVWSKVRKLESFSYEYGTSSERYSLCADPGYSFLKWWLDGEFVSLKKTQRYPLLDLATGKIGWARVNKTVITFFGDGVSHSKSVLIGDYNFNLSFEGNWGSYKTGKNLLITLNPQSINSKIVFSCSYDIESLNDLKLEKELSLNLDISENIVDWITFNPELFKKIISSKVILPFDYKQKLIGKQANVFFEDYTGWIKLALCKIRNEKLLIASRLN